MTEGEIRAFVIDRVTQIITNQYMTVADVVDDIVKKWVIDANESYDEGVRDTVKESFDD